jgi:hypothetical protein
MTEFLNALKADLLDRRMLPLVVLVVLALVGAIGYAALGGGSSSPAAVATNSAPVHAKGISISQAPANPNEAISETTNGATVQRKGHAHNPFSPLPGSTVSLTTASSSKTSSSSTTTASGGAGGTSTKATGKSESGSTTLSSGSTPPSKPSKPSTPSKPRPVYNVDLLLGVLPAGTAPQSAVLTPFANVKLLSPLPSAKQPLLIFRGVTAGGKSAAFTLVGEAIIHGNATCLPSTTKCELILLKPGQTEQLEYLPQEGQLVTYELRLVSIAQAKATSASLKRAGARESKVGRSLLGQAGLKALGGLRYSQTAGVLVFPRHRASAARAHAALAGADGKR